MTAPGLMVAGTGSGVGKTCLVAGLGRVLARRGYDVAPFKAQNMSNNSHVAKEGGEIAVSQSVQARACRCTPSVTMNPILLKPNGNGESEVLVNGTPDGVMEWSEYRNRYFEMRRTVLEAYETTAENRDVVLLEGAGSPAEPNLMEDDLVNLSLAEDLDVPVVLVGDISHGGVFAWLLGTIEMLEPSQRELIQGIVINKFRGDPSVLDEAIDELEQRVNVPVLGVIPHSEQARLPSEDSQDLSSLCTSAETDRGIKVGMVRFPHLSNFTDFERLAEHPRVEFRLIEPNRRPGDLDAIVLPGTKNTLRDLHWLKREGLAGWLEDQCSGETELLGVCGGYQMMGTTLRDPDGLESDLGEIEGLGWFDFEVEFRDPKITRRVTVTRDETDLTGNGYEVRYGRFLGGSAEPWARDEDGTVLARSSKNRLGTSVHGLFRNEDFLEAFLRRTTDDSDPGRLDGTSISTRSRYDRWADVVEENLDVETLLRRVHFPVEPAQAVEGP